MMRARVTVGAVVMLLAISGGARASHPEDSSDCRGTIGGMYIRHPDIRIPVVADGVIIPIVHPELGPFYLNVQDVASAYWTFFVEVYMKTNGAAGLQRGGRSLVPDTPGTGNPSYCNQSITPDQLIF